ncbi:MAG: acyltransferase [Betaproteobacteria bacterium]|nr:acyltransferase [Betaproteobacteria bacterium]
MLNSLQAGRAVAAVAVAAFHLTIQMGHARYGGQPVFGDYTRYGDFGVDFFFVLSGFIILFAHFEDIGKPGRWRNYAYRRFVRLFPIYWLYTALFVLVLAIFGGTDAKIPVSVGDWVTALSLVRFTAGQPPLPVAWTLFYELAFYAVFSILIVSRRIGLLALGIFMVVVACAYQFPADNSQTPFKVYTAAFNLYFLFGMCAYLLYRRGGGEGWIELILGVILTSAGLAVVSVPRQIESMLLVLGFSLLLAGVTKLERHGVLNVPSFLRALGDASYTIYLTHVSIVGLLLKITMKVQLYQYIGFELVFFVVLAGTVAIGYVAYYVVERPLLNWLRRRSRVAHSQGDELRSGGA